MAARRALALLVAMLLALATGAAELPPEIQVDRLLVQVDREAADGNPWSAIFTLERVLSIYEEHGLEVPSDYWFRQADAYHRTGMHQRAVEAATRYLEEAGREGQHYRAALELLDAAEAALMEAERDAARARAAVERARREAERRREVIASATPEMVVIPAGIFRMGCVSGRKCESDERPIRDVAIAGFAMSKTEVTFDQWDICTEHGGCRRVKDVIYRIHKEPGEGWGRGNRPVINVSWDDAQSYVSWLSRETGEEYRLPSEAEWEYAARAGSSTAYWWGDKIGRNRANCKGCRSRWGERTAPVGSFAANGFGLHDMHGNVWEWVEDCYFDSYRGAPGDGSAPVSRLPPKCRRRAVMVLQPGHAGRILAFVQAGSEERFPHPRVAPRSKKQQHDRLPDRSVAIHEHRRWLMDAS